MHAYRTHTCAALARRACRADRPPVGLGAPQARPRRGAVRRPARPLRAHADRLRRGFAGAARCSSGLRLESVVTIDGNVKARAEGTTNPNLPTGEIEVYARAVDRAEPRRGAADAGGGRAGVSRGHPPQVPLPRPAARERARQHDAAQPGHRQPAPAHDRAGLHRVPDPDPDRHRAPRARATTWCRAGSIRASSTRSRRRRRCSSSC